MKTSNFNEYCPLEKLKLNYKNSHEWVTKVWKVDVKKREEFFKIRKKIQQNETFKHIKNRNIVLSRQMQVGRKLHIYNVIMYYPLCSKILFKIKDIL